VNAADKDGDTPLHIAANHDDPDIIALCLHYGAHLNAVNQVGETPLIQAVQHNSIESVRTLLSSHAEVNLRDTQGKTALDSVGNDAIEIRQMLRKAGARTGKELAAQSKYGTRGKGTETHQPGSQ